MAQGTKTQAGPAPASDAVTRRLDRLEVSLGAVERLDREVRTASGASIELRDQVNRMKQDLEEAVQTSEEKVLRNVKNNIGLIEKELGKTTASSNTFKATLDDVSRKIERMREYFNINVIYYHDFQMLREGRRGCKKCQKRSERSQCGGYQKGLCQGPGSN